MKCQSTSLVHGFIQKCKNEAVTRVWCPTWIGAEDGPLNVCDTHLAIFDKRNPFAPEGAFFFGDNAQKVFESVTFVKEIDELAQQLKERGTTTIHPLVMVLDGNAYLLKVCRPYYNRTIVILGEIEAAKVQFPTLL